MAKEQDTRSKEQLVTSRRAFLKGAGASVAIASMASAGLAPGFLRNARASGELKIVQWSHFVPAYDQWFDKFAKAWGRANGVEVSVDHIPHLELPARMAAEVSAQAGHDLFGLNGAGGAHLYIHHLEDLSDLVHEMEGKYGKVGAAGRGVAYDEATNTWPAYPDYYIRFPGLYREDLWGDIGMKPDSWDDVRRGGAKLKKKGHPVGIGLAHHNDANDTWRGVLWSFGGQIADKLGKRCVLSSNETLEAIKFSVALYKEAMTNEVFSWDDASNNRFLDSGKGCYISNPISAYRSAQKSNPALADKIAIWKTPKGPARRLVAGSPNSYLIWKFAQNKDNARAFLAHYAENWTEGFKASTGYNHPVFDHIVKSPMPILSNDPTSHPHDKLKVLETANDWMAIFGWPGPGNPASDEIANNFIIPDMMAQAATGKMTPREAMEWGQKHCDTIYTTWAQLG
jgi:multiple sugar transport system substrate-binding protein